MIDKVKNTIMKYNMLYNIDGIVVGVSGGADSICLLHMLYHMQTQYNFKIQVVHVHHGIRGIDADEDAEFVQKFCKKINVTCSIYRFDIKKEAKLKKITEEEAGRQLRYEVFEKERSKFTSGKIAVAHHMNDQAETVLHNLFRGTGTKGLGAIRPNRGNIIRPLINCTRKQIENYCKKNNLLYKTDYTNTIDIYTRNKIRLNLIPYIEQNFNPKIVKSLAQTAYILQEEEDYLENQMRINYNKCVSNLENRLVIDLEIFKKMPKALQLRILRRVLEHTVNSLKDIHFVHVENLYDLTLKETGKKINLPKGIIVQKSYEQLIICNNNKESKSKMFNYIINEFPYQKYITECKKELQCSIEKNEKNQAYPKNNYMKWFDYDKIKSDLELRNRLPGDYIKIKGINGKKKLKDYFIDEKIPREIRNTIPLLADKNQIIWIVGYRINEEYKVNDNTKNILKVSFN